MSNASLNNHIQNSHFGHQRDVCTKCGEIIEKNIGLKKHIDSCGKGSVGAEHKRDKSREVCIHWRRGKCDRGSQCNFSHVGHQDSPRPKNQSTRMTPEPCRNGTDCSYFAKGRCNFGHHKANGHHPEQQGRRPSKAWDRGQSGRGREQSGRGQSERGRRQDSDRLPCRFGPDCDRVINCPYIHSMEDFPQYSKKQVFRGTNRTRNNRN